MSASTPSVLPLLGWVVLSLFAAIHPALLQVLTSMMLNNLMAAFAHAS